MKKISWKIFVPALCFVLLLVFIESLEYFYNFRFGKYGVFPRTIKGMRGIFFSPFLHGDWKHVLNNSIPIIVLGTSLRYFYKTIAKEVFLWSWLMSGIWLWSIGRESYHIGASGIVYALVSFLFFSGLFRKHTKLMAISFFVVFLYGSMVWGLFPIQEHISWEGHLSGALAGIILAWWFRNEGPPKQVYQYEIDEELEKARPPEIHYDYKES